MNDTDELNTQLFAPVVEAITEAHLVAYDGCHKIYLAMDEEQAEWFRENYAPDTFEGTAEEMLATVIGWYENSCFLRFVNAVATNHADPNAGFTSLIPQFVEEIPITDDDEDEILTDDEVTEEV